METRDNSLRRGENIYYVQQEPASSVSWSQEPLSSKIKSPESLHTKNTRLLKNTPNHKDDTINICNLKK